ncbi:helix-turn-helix domain-containing protein [Williamsia muralis]|uniref:helix-turn-helix domain-containing protein n=1 Tax=Williamsia marianensis TaxID=85044 RepID=UPI000DE6831B|nr:helix-turn-helix transcriptional regulator [Williamsia marianensis]PVY29912.1 helix-turn-helix protein [Williamsia marianensis]
MKLSESRERFIRKVLGGNVRRLRLAAGVRVEDLAKEAKRQGLQWSVSRVGDMEGGRVEAKVETLLAVAQALANVTGQPVTLADLMAGEDRAAWFQGEPVQPEPEPEQQVAPADIARRNSYESLQHAAEKLQVSEAEVAPVLLAYEDTGLVDQRAAKALGLKVKELTRHAVALWGHNFTTERDRVAGPDAHAARLGEVNRALRAQVQERLDGHQNPTEPSEGEGS